MFTVLLAIFFVIYVFIFFITFYFLSFVIFDKEKRFKNALEIK